MSPHIALPGPPRWRPLLRRGLLAALAVSMLATGVALAASSASYTLKPGSTGATVKQLQNKLHVRTTGSYDSRTRTAVKRYQASHGLTADGIAGPATLDRLGIDVRQASYGSGGTSAGDGSSSDGSKVRLPAELDKIAQCESGGNPRAVSPSGRYRGKYQFDKSTWIHAGGSGDPAKAPEATQDRIALALYRKRGSAPWPNCG